MDTIIIGQGYNLKEDTSVGKELIEQFESNRYKSFTCLVAFASYGGISALTSYVKKAKDNGVQIKVILGVDQKGTSKEALEEVLSWGVDSKIYHTQSVTIFHPKIYLFENEDIFTMIVGSNNLTEMGLVKNVECSLLIKDIKSNPVYAKFYEYWNSILDGTEVNLYTITQQLIDDLLKDGIITSEQDRSSRYDDGRDDVKTTKRISFKKGKIQHLPNGFIPKRLVKVKKQTNSTNGNDKKITEESIHIGNEVLVAEIGGGDRWKQVNFPIKIFENFFGAQRGNNTYKINLQNITKDGELGEIVSRPSITVKSNNYRFELSCEETRQPYPKGTNRPIGIYVKLTDTDFLYRVLMPGYEAYQRIKDYLYREAEVSRTGELKRKIVHVEAIHALYPDWVI